MPRRARVTQPGFHHIINRGVARQNVFRNRSDKDYFLKLLDEVFISYDFILHSYILMDNHYHLLIENQRDNLSAGMRKLNSNYAQYFNKKYNRIGHLWQDRYVSKYIQNELYLIALHKYIEYNPIKANITIDIAIYLKNNTDIFDKKLRIHLDLSKLLNKEIDLIILNETKSYSLLKDILDNHILLKDSPDDSREMFEVTKHHDILDFQVFQRMIDVA